MVLLGYVPGQSKGPGKGCWSSPLEIRKSLQGVPLLGPVQCADCKFDAGLYRTVGAGI